MASSLFPDFSNILERKEFELMARDRPFVVTILALLALLGAAQALIVTLQMLHLLPVYIGELHFWTFDFWGALMWGILFLIYMWIFRMLWNVEPQGWLFLVIISGLNLILAFLYLLGGSSWEALSAAIIINGLILIYCLLPGTKKAFEIPT
jgi:hypothetical protein